MNPRGGKLLGQSRLSSKNQVVIPSEVREELKLKSGDLVCFIKEGNRIVVVKGPVEVKL